LGGCVELPFDVPFVSIVLPLVEVLVPFVSEPLMVVESLLVEPIGSS
jgi:hypothetical protein